MPSSFDGRRELFGAAKKFLLEAPAKAVAPSTPASDDFDPPRLTLAALEKISMSRSRERILSNLEELYREAFQRAAESEDAAQKVSLDFAYRREQLYLEVLLDVRDVLERRG